ncbi:MAG: acyl-CoA thioesterase [Victivallales bacterium]|nr:acyl-CoA thioesterase [Victivallales bacterium]MBO7090411.1 acyl-CoA thioesterase [Victivallales bacterium]MBR4370029.1 acyl-CoA thioesterase [Victivallales bacterium]MBR5025565.1 acyl-CoA thioesterase [Victivallales bacterium]
MIPENTTQYRVCYADTDQMGVVYYANYFMLFERARTELLRLNGLSYRQIEEQGFMLPVLDAHAKYHRPARYDDLLDVTARVVEFDGLKLKTACEVKRDGVLLVDGDVTLVFLNAQTGRPSRPPENIRKIFE